MAINIRLEYGGVVICSIPITFNRNGYHLTGLISNIGATNSQVGHLSKLNGPINSGVASVDSTVAQFLRIILQCDTVDDISDGDFVALRHTIVEVLKDA